MKTFSTKFPTFFVAVTLVGLFNVYVREIVMAEHGCLTHLSFQARNELFMVHTQKFNHRKPIYPKWERSEPCGWMALSFLYAGSFEIVNHSDFESYILNLLHEMGCIWIHCRNIWKKKTLFNFTSFKYFYTRKWKQLSTFFVRITDNYFKDF